MSLHLTILTLCGAFIAGIGVGFIGAASVLQRRMNELIRDIRGEQRS